MGGAEALMELGNEEEAPTETFPDVDGCTTVEMVLRAGCICTNVPIEESFTTEPTTGAGCMMDPPTDDMVVVAVLPTVPI